VNTGNIYINISDTRGTVHFQFGATA